ncbi:uncharacterized protein JCM6883_001027 [Sporobolomyces salmoneus]|uniref:uncharacterized protein n=1 Tax=Sporobolomyces salmoneus TaxID=183962 RepID=UPI0031779A1C
MGVAPIVLTTQQQQGGLSDLLNSLHLGGGNSLVNNDSDPSVSITRIRRTRKISIQAFSPDGSSAPCPVHIRFLGSSGGPCSCNIADILRGVTGHTANSDYLSQVNVPSRVVTATNPLLVISLDGVIDARLPYHLSGGYTDTISRPYLGTLMKYLLLQKTPWCFVFYTSMSRQDGLKALKELNLPTGGPEDDERDGVLGLFAADDMRNWKDSPKPIKDLDSMWQALYEEEGIHWGVHNTVVLSHDPQEMAKQPYSFIHVPRLDYKSVVRPVDDMFLLLMIAILKDLETETNFAYHIKDMKYNDLDTWTSKSTDAVNERNHMLNNAVRICAGDRISIRALTGNKRDAA